MELKLLRVSDVIQLFKIHRNTVRNWEKEGRLVVAKRIGRLVFFREADVLQILNEGNSQNESSIKPDSPEAGGNY